MTKPLVANNKPAKVNLEKGQEYYFLPLRTFIEPAFL